MPVLPEVGSRIVCPGWIAPSASAPSIIALATRSLTEPVGLRPSSLAKIRTPGFGVIRGNSTSGVLPTASRTLPYRPPQGRLRVSSSIALASVVRNGVCSGRPPPVEGEDTENDQGHKDESRDRARRSRRDGGNRRWLRGRRQQQHYEHDADRHAGHQRRPRQEG